MFVSALSLVLPYEAFSQCEDFIVLDASTWLECVTGSGYVKQVYYAEWTGGTPPYHIGFEQSAPHVGPNWVMWEGSPETSDGEQGTVSFTFDVYDSNGCLATRSALPGPLYWVDTQDQVVLQNSVWDPLSGTATVTLVDNPTDAGTELPYGPNVTYWLSCTSDPANDRFGSAVYNYFPSPPRYMFPQLPPGNYELWLSFDGLPDLGTLQQCSGLAAWFQVDQGASAIAVSPRVFLGGAWPSGGTTMNDGLRSGGLIPLTAPYAAMGYSYTGSHGPATTTANVLVVTGPNAIVDWVVVELRSATTPATVVASRPALVQRDGDVVAPDGVSTLTFNSPPGNYHVAVKHRNHLGVMTAAPRALSGTPASIDMTLAATAAYGTNARQNVSGTMVLWPGDVNFDGTARYTGSGNDRDPVLQAIGGSTPTNVVTSTYSSRDINLDGTIRYTGANNDRDIILQTIGGTVPTAVRVGQVP